MSEQKGNKLLIILVVFTLLLVIGLGAVLGYYIFFKDKTKGAAQGNTEVKIEENVVELNEFLVNLSDEEKVYMKVKFALAYNKKDKKLGDEITEKMPVIRDTIITILRQKKSTDFEDPSGKENKLELVKKQILKNINEKLTKGQLTNVYIQDIIIQ